MSDPICEPVLTALRNADAPTVALRGAAWLIWPTEQPSVQSAATSTAQFVHLSAPAVAVQRNGRMEYFDVDGHRAWTSNLVWPRTYFEMMRLPGRPSALNETPAGDASAIEISSEK